MRISRYWARAYVDERGAPCDEGGIIGIGWSEISEADAREKALGRARRIAEHLRGRDTYPPGEDYYADRPLREPIIDELHQDGRLVAAITRNVYGAFVLNAASAMFIDMDRPQAPHVGMIARLFGGKPAPAADDTVDRVAEVVGRHAGLGLRLYETAAGYRGLITSEPFDPEAAHTITLLQSFGSDRLYVQLCRSQQCFRARLTPKPWRIGMPNPPQSYPWIDERRRQAFENWSGKYEQAIDGYAVCRPVGVFGEPAVHPEVMPVLALHDQWTCGEMEELA